MDFEPLDEELEEFLRMVIDRTDECSGYADGIEYANPEFRALDELGYFEDTHKYIDLTASVKPAYSALRYFERKKRWGKEKIAGHAGKAGGKLVDKGIDLAATIVAKSIMT